MGANTVNRASDYALANRRLQPLGHLSNKSTNPPATSADSTLGDGGHAGCPRRIKRTSRESFPARRVAAMYDSHSTPAFAAHIEYALDSGSRQDQSAEQGDGSRAIFRRRIERDHSEGLWATSKTA